MWIIISVINILQHLHWFWIFRLYNVLYWQQQWQTTNHFDIRQGYSSDI